MVNSNYIFVFFGIIIGLLFYNKFLVPDIKTKVEIRETIVTDTVYTLVRDTVTITRFKYIYERDTIIENFKPKIRGFKEAFVTLHGNAYLTGEVLGELRYASLTTDFRFPTVTNTITKEKTSRIIIEPTGIFLTGGINSNFSYSIGATYLKNNAIIGYNYQPQTKIHALNVGFKVF